ncbi:MAG: glucosamine-6-phosphate deaminase [Gordonibacter sp.]
MEFIIAESTEDMSRRAADHIAACLQADPDCVLGLATGTTPIGLYAELVEDCAEGKVSFAGVTTFNLDEYRGLAPEHDQSYRYFMKKHLFDHVDIDQARTHVPEGANLDAHAVCAAYEEAIAAAGGVDMQLLGLGPNGHIGFNEPEDTFPAATHCVDLTQSTIEANSRLFECIDDVPRQAYTMGIGTIMAARSVLMVVEGAHKAEIVKKAFFGPVTPQVPASILQFHQNVTVIVDPAAGELCRDKA